MRHFRCCTNTYNIFSVQKLNNLGIKISDSRTAGQIFSCRWTARSFHFDLDRTERQSAGLYRSDTKPSVSSMLIPCTGALKFPLGSHGHACVSVSSIVSDACVATDLYRAYKASFDLGQCSGIERYARSKLHPRGVCPGTPTRAPAPARTCIHHGTLHTNFFNFLVYIFV